MTMFLLIYNLNQIPSVNIDQEYCTNELNMDEYCMIVMLRPSMHFLFVKVENLDRFISNFL